MDGRAGAGALVDLNSLNMQTATHNFILSDPLGGVGGVCCGSPWQMSNFITEPCMNVAPHPPHCSDHAAIIWSFWETEVLDCNLWAVTFKSLPQLRWWRQPPEPVCAFKGYMCRSLSRSPSGTKVKGSLTAWEKVEQCEITLIQRFLPHTSPMNP